MLISLSGIDGVGKSALASWIQERLAQAYGLDSHYVWCKFGNHPLSRFRLARTAGRVGFGKPGATQREGERATFRLSVYGGTMLVFHLAQIALVVRRLLGRGDVVVCDRYIFDTMVDLQKELHYSKERVRGILDRRWIPQPNTKLLLDLSEQIALARKPSHRSVEHWHECRALYLDIAHDHGLTIVDASQPIDVVGEIAVEQIKEDGFQKGPASS